MKYFTREEALSIIRYTPLNLCVPWEENPNLEAMKALDEYIQRSKFPNDRFIITCTAFLLGHATGVREERARRKKRQEVTQP